MGKETTTYDLAAVKRAISKYGFRRFCDHVQSPDLSEPVKSDLIQNHILVNGYLNLSLIDPV